MPGLFLFVRMTREVCLLTCADMSSPFLLLPHRSVLALRGPDTIALLERLVTNATTDWSIGETRYGALLTPQGKVIADYLATRTDDGVLLDVAKETADELAKRLKMFRLRSQVEIDLLTNMHVFVALDDASIGAEPIAGADLVFCDPRYANGRLRAFTEREDWGAAKHSIHDYHVDRMDNVVPEQGTDFGSAEVFPADINMDVLGGIALNKGCFVGQEVVSRMHRRGKIRKRTLKIETSDQNPVQPGEEIKAPLPIGVVTSAEQWRALAIIRTDRLQRAETTGDAPTLNETPVTITKPGWLLAELAPMEET